MPGFIVLAATAVAPRADLSAIALCQDELPGLRPPTVSMYIVTTVHAPHVLLLPALLSTLVIAGCGGSSEGESPARQAATPSPAANPTAAPASATVPSTAESLPNGPWTDLAKRLVAANNLDTAVNVTREVLARGGVATYDGERTLVNVTGPASLVRVGPRETVHMAMEARRRQSSGRLTVAELAQMLEAFGFPFPNARERGDNADTVPWGKPAPGTEEKMREAELADRASAREAARGADEGMRQQIAREQQESRARIDAAQARVRELTDAWQKARQAVGKSPAGERAAAEARVKGAWDARGAAIQELNRIRNAEDAAEDERRTRESRASNDSYRLERIQRNIGPDYANGERLMAMLSAWVRNALANPNDPRSFTPLFLAEMARLQDPPIDLLGSRFSRIARGEGAPVDLRSGPRSGQLRVTLLELQLLAGAFLRLPPGTGSFGEPFGMRRPEVLRASYVPPGQANPCSDLMKDVEKIGKTVGGDAGGAAAGGLVGSQAGEALDKAVESAIGEAAAETFGKMMDALNLASKIARLVSFYGDTEVSVTPDESTVHKRLGEAYPVVFTATAGVNDKDLEEYQRALEKLSAQDRATRDCLESAGMPKLSNLGDLAREAEEWLIEWRIVEGSPPHAYFSLDRNNLFIKGTRQATKMTRASASSATSFFVVDIVPEAKHEGKIVRAPVTVRASVDAAQAPSLGTLLNPLTGVLGLVESLVEVGAGWFQHMNQPKAYATIMAEYHCPRPTTFYDTGKPVGDGGGGDGPNDCIIAGQRK